MADATAEITLDIKKLIDKGMQQRIDALEKENKQLREELSLYEGDNK